MSEENVGQEQVVEQAPAQPKNDAEAAQLEQAAAKKAEGEAAKAEEEAAKKKNRTSQYIDRLKGDADSARRENAELRKRLDAIETRFPKQEAKPPTMESVGFDPEELTRQTVRYQVEQERQKWVEQQKSDAAAQSEQEKLRVYAGRAQAFASQNPDFEEVVGSIPQQALSPELQRAIMLHEKGPEIAYQLAQNEDELFQLAAYRPELIEWAVSRYASRLDAAPATQEPAQAAPLAFAPPPTTKPTTQAPAPVPRVTGRSPTKSPPEKMTDDEWYRDDRESRRKR